MTARTRRQTGFTLVEMIVVIVITGILAGIVAVFIKAPLDSYIDMGRRADLTDAADTAVRRIARDVRLALPNSLRNPDAADQCVEFMPTRIGGRYRAAQTAAGTGDILDFTSVDGSFDMLWTNSALPAANRIAAGDIVVVYNDGYTGNAYLGSNAVQVAGVCEPPAVGCAATPANSTAISFVAVGANVPFDRKQFPAESAASRFQVVPSDAHVVAYVCSGIGTANGSGTGTLFRRTRTLAAAAPLPAPAVCPAVPAGTPILAQNVSACSLRYEAPGSGTGLSRNGILSISIEITRDGESVRLYQQVHVDNTP